MCELFVRVELVYEFNTACVNLPYRIRSPFTAAVTSTCTVYTHYVVAQELLGFLLPPVYIYEGTTVATLVRVLPEKTDHQ